MLTAIPIEKKKHHCIDSVFLTVAHHFNRDIGLMSVGSWGFDYQPSLVGANTFGEKLRAGMVMPSRETLARYHGIDVDWRENVSWEELTAAINMHIRNNRPLGIFINSYYCPWNPAYHLAEVDHYCIVVDCDPNLKNYYCVDSYFAQSDKCFGRIDEHRDTYLLSEDDLRLGFREYISFSLKEPVKKYLLAKIFRDVQLSPEDYPKRRKNFENMIQFGIDLSQNLDIELEVADCKGQIESSKLYRQFIQYSQRRLNFADALRFLRDWGEDVTLEMSDSLNTVSDKFENVAGQWFKMGILLIKLSLTKKAALREKMGDLMELIAGEELDLLRNVTDIGRMAI